MATQCAQSRRCLPIRRAEARVSSLSDPRPPLLLWADWETLEGAYISLVILLHPLYNFNLLFRLHY